MRWWVPWYLRWPCLVNPHKDAIPGSPTMQWSAKLESVRKDIEGVFGILKKRFKFLKNFNVLQPQSAIVLAPTSDIYMHNIVIHAVLEYSHLALDEMSKVHSEEIPRMSQVVQ